MPFSSGSVQSLRSVHPTGTALEKTHKENAAAADDDEVGVANKSYFMPGPSLDLGLRESLIDKTSLPDILKSFEIFYMRINIFCAISLRYSEKREVCPIAMHFSKAAAANALIDEWKSVELCQAYFLLSIYAMLACRWEEDRSWLYTCLAIRCVDPPQDDACHGPRSFEICGARVATDLNLHILHSKKPTMEQQKLEMLNRTRIWIICFNIDKSTATQIGKPSTLKEDFIVRKSLEWYKSFPNNHLCDVHIIAYRRCSGLSTNSTKEFSRIPPYPIASNGTWTTPLLPLFTGLPVLLSHYSYTNYARLVMLSVGFQIAFQLGLEADDKVFFTRSLESAKTVVMVLVDSLVPTGYLLRPEYSRFITPGHETEVYQVIERLIATIGSPRIEIDEHHTSKLYSRFLDVYLNRDHHHSRCRPDRVRQGTSNHHNLNHHSNGNNDNSSNWPPPPQNTTSSSLSSGVSSNAGAPDLHQSVPQNSGATAPPNFTNAVSTEGPGNYVLEQPPDFMFGVVGQPGELMDFTFDTITTPGNDDLLATMQAIQNPTWWQNMTMPGSADTCLYILSTRLGLTSNTRMFFWPAEEVIQDDTNTIGNGMNTYQNLQQPAERLCG
ncbi:hypothetical protein F5148DRAFT_1148883 [Russula earlei]|uniref:Uncharacterized protein n=1 Tax=Russula earlei TaxID=71964 RepID=A0ACC0UC03_9AGAM|nr:hypothetical protein F5148DRAFT_1148883 [Russula earlei]